MKKMIKTEEPGKVNLEKATENKENKKWTDELIIACRELAFQQYKQDQRVADFAIVN